MIGAAVWKGAAAVAVARLAVPALNVATVVLMARWAGPGRLGDYTFLITLCLLLEQAKSLGLQHYFLREMAATPAGAADHRASLIRMGRFGAALAVPLFVGLAAFNGMQSPGGVLAAGVMSIGLVASIWAVANETQLLASRRAATMAGIALFENLIRAALSIYVVWRHDASLPLLALAYSVSRLVAVSLQQLLGRFEATGKAKPIRELLREAPAFATIYLGPLVLFRLDVIVLGMLATSTDVGLYSAAARLLAVAMIVPDAILTSAFVEISRRFGQGDEAGAWALFRKQLLLGAAVLVPAAAVGSVLAPWLVTSLFGQSYARSAAPLRVLFWALPVFVCARAAGDLLIARGQQRAAARAVALTGLLGAVGYVWAIDRSGIIGAASGFLGVALLMAGLASFELARSMKWLGAVATPRRHLPVVALTLVVAVSAACLVTEDTSTANVITVRPSRTAGTVSPLLFGAAVEWTDDGNRILDAERGALRRDVIDALKPLRLSVIRFPGGILSDHYHWRDGVGPRAQRPARRHPMDGTEQRNNFGTDEFIEFSRALGAEPLITANAGSGTLADALAWQAYFRDKGFPVRYWEIGNEIYLTEPVDNAPIPGNDKRIFHTGQDYRRRFVEWASALRSADRTVMVGAIAGTFNTGSRHKSWISDLLGQGARDIDFIALHNSFAPIITKPWNYRDAEMRRTAYAAMFAHTEQVSFDVRGVTKGFREAGPRSEPRIAITEHFPLFGVGGPQLNELLDQSRTLASAIYTASLFHSWIRDGVWMANYNIAVSPWFGALVTDGPKGLVRTPTYHVYDLYRNVFGTTLVETSMTGATFSTPAVGTVGATRGVKLLDAVSSTSADGSVTVAVVNRSVRTALSASMVVEGLPAGADAEVFTIGADVPNTINGPTLTESTVSGSVEIKKSVWKLAPEYLFPPHSITLFRWKGARITR